MTYDYFDASPEPPATETPPSCWDCGAEVEQFVDQTDEHLRCERCASLRAVELADGAEAAYAEGRIESRFDLGGDS